MNSSRSQDKTTAPKSELQTLHLNENENEAPPQVNCETIVIDAK